TKVLGRDGFSINHETVELRYVEQIVDSGQSAALCRALLYCGRHFFDGKTTLTEAVDRLMELLQIEGLKLLCENSYLVTGLTLPRKQEILASLNRCRFLEIK
ncbi:MAG: isopentenyl-diphosphate delta-isomerase, partial [Lachnospiraceae bacterium]|nr:isopentenyl-diphosphate delta-isomerase [Lachnospiraceae bacterium]